MQAVFTQGLRKARGLHAYAVLRRAADSVQRVAIPVATVADFVGFVCAWLFACFYQFDANRNLAGRADGHKQPSQSFARTGKQRAFASQGQKLYFLFLDVDDFKSINDLYGHYDGDKTLQTVADALRAVCKTTGGICGRYGGDEFVMVQQLEENDDIRIVCSLIHDKVSEFNDNSDSDYDVSVSVGYSVFGGDGDDVQSLIQRADKQMYSRKRGGSKPRK